MCLQRSYRDLLSWHVGSYMILISYVTHMLVTAQTFPDGKYHNFNFPGYPDLRIHKGSLSGYMAYVMLSFDEHLKNHPTKLFDGSESKCTVLRTSFWCFKLSQIKSDLNIERKMQNCQMNKGILLHVSRLEKCYWLLNFEANNPWRHILSQKKSDHLLMGHYHICKRDETFVKNMNTKWVHCQK